jgi:hypothetical protein
MLQRITPGLTPRVVRRAASFASNRGAGSIGRGKNAIAP